MTIHKSTQLNHIVFKNIQISSQENMIIKSLEKFYEENTNINLFIPIVNSESVISIRLIDHFVTKYSKNNKINYKIIENDIEQTFNVHTSYKQQLKAYQKKHFDPFSRGDRIPYFMDDTCIITTIGQLNFFRWFISKKVYDYIKNNHDIIENDMNKRTKNDKHKKHKDTKPSKLIKTPCYYVQPSQTITNYKSTSNGILSFASSREEKIIVSFFFN